MIGAAAPGPGVEVELEVAVPARDEVHGANGGLGQRGPAEVGVKHHARGVEHGPEPRSPALAQPLANLYRPVLRRPGPPGARRRDGLPDRGHHRAARRRAQEGLHVGIAQQAIHRGQLAAAVGHGLGFTGRRFAESAGALVGGRGGRAPFVVSVTPGPLTRVVSAAPGLGTVNPPRTSLATPVVLRTPRISTSYLPPGAHGRATRITSLSVSGGRLVSTSGWMRGCAPRPRAPGGGTAGTSRIPGRSRAVVSDSVSLAGAARPWMLSSSILVRIELTWTGVESGKTRTVTASVRRCCRGSSVWLSETTAARLSPTVISWILGGVVSCTNAHSSPAAVFPGASRTESNASRGSTMLLWFWSITPRTRYSPLGSGPSAKCPVESATPRYGRLSLRSSASTNAAGAGRLELQSTTVPSIVVVGSSAPVVKVSTAPRLL